MSKAALRNFNGLASWRSAENSLQSVNVTMPSAASVALREPKVSGPSIHLPAFACEPAIAAIRRAPLLARSPQASNHISFGQCGSLLICQADAGSQRRVQRPSRVWRGDRSRRGVSAGGGTGCIVYRKLTNFHGPSATPTGIMVRCSVSMQLSRQPALTCVSEAPRAGQRAS